MKTAEAKATKKPLSMWTIIMVIILVVYIMSFIIPSGSYEYVDKMAVPGTYQQIEKVYLSPSDVVMTLGETVYASFGALFIVIIIMGGMMGIVNSTRVLDRTIMMLCNKLQDKSVWIIPAFIYTMGFFGTLGSMISTCALFIPLSLSIASQLKCDRTFAVGLIVMGSYTGFMSSPFNPLTTVMAQTIAGIAPFSGSELRTAVTIINLGIVSLYMMWVANKSRRDPKVWENDFKDATDVNIITKVEPLSICEWLILIVFFGSFILFALGSAVLGFNTLSLGSIMLPVGIICGILARYPVDKIMNEFVKGSQNIIGVVVFMILASVMNVILTKSLILDTVVYYMSLPLSSLSSSLAGIGMFIANAIINIFITSGSGQTAIMMPMMAPLSDVIGVTRQMAVLTLQFGDGFTNLLAPTSVILLACISQAKTTLSRWYKFIVPVYSIIFVVLCATIIMGTTIGY